MLDRDAWLAPATPEQTADAVATVVTLVEEEASPERIGTLARYIAQRGYTAAEMRLIAQEGPAANHYGKRVNLHTLDEIVNDARKIRAMLDRVLTGDELATLCTAHPEISPRDFACAGHDGRNQPLWKHAPEIAAKARARNTQHIAELPEFTPEPRPRSTDGLSFSEMVEAEMDRLRTSTDPAQA